MPALNLIGSYNYPLVALSVLIAMFASYTALDLAGRVTAATGWARAVWLLGGAVAMGTGIWSMHYVGMLALILPIPVAYHWPTVLLSFLAAVFASAVALYVVSRQKIGAVQALAGSVLMGTGIAGMHYIGMEAMRLQAACHYSFLLVVLSILLAILISLLALRISFQFREKQTGFGRRRVAGAIALGAAIPLMHYTGMAAANFTPSSNAVDLSDAVSISTLGTAGIVAVTLIVLGLALLTSWVDRRFVAQTLELHQSNERYRKLFERSLAGVYRVDLDGWILDCNDACSRILGYGSRKEHLSQAGPSFHLRFDDWEEFVDALKKKRALSNFERCLRQKDDSRAWVLENATLLECQDTHSPVIEGTLIDITERKRMETELRQANAQLQARQCEIDEELQLAARVQQSLVPTCLTWGDLSVEAFYLPARTIGGDFGLVTSRADRLDVLVCDVSGHGIGSALVANRIYSEAISQIELGVGLTAMMDHLNRFVLRNLRSAEFFFTMVALRFSRDGRTLEFAGAGHPPVMIVHPGQVPRQLESRSAVLGFFEGAVNGEVPTEVSMEPGDRVVIYTDGFIESFNTQEEMLGLEGFTEIVRAAATLPLASMKQEIVERVVAWRSGPPTDDMSLVVIGIPHLAG
jgi:PAS domain S-box-containing protein